jgi:uncharacterized LabA/DUF88 family protein
MKPAANFSELTKISDDKKRKVTISKRKRGLFKKAIEMSMLGGLDIFMVIFDKDKQKIFELNSDTDFDIQIVSHLLDKINLQ